MAGRRPASTGDVGLDMTINAMLDEIDPKDDRDLLFDILVSGAMLAANHVDRLDLKIVSAALREMRSAFEAFAPYRDRRKVTVFGSARTVESDPLYELAKDLAAQMAAEGWMVTTGAGPGIMLAAMEGAGRADSFGVRIRLPFESGANQVIAGDSKLVSMKYFFTRKLMLMKESSAYVSLPGGFGTLDEMFELLTLQQTGKSIPAPVVLLDVPGGTFWQGWRSFMEGHVAAGAFIGPSDIDIASITDSVTEAYALIENFTRVYHSIRWVGDRLVIRLQRPITPLQLGELNDRYESFCRDGGRIEPSAALPVEIRHNDNVDLPRLILHLDPFAVGRLHELIGTLNTF